MRRSIILAVLVIMTCSCSVQLNATPKQPTVPVTTTPDPCDLLALQSYRAVYMMISNRWSLAVIEAGQARTTELKTIIEDMSRIADDFAILVPPPCAQPIHNRTLQAMQQTIVGYQGLMDQKNIGATLSDAINAFGQAQVEMSALPGTPVPTDTPIASATPRPTLTPASTPTPLATPTPTATPAPRIGYTSRQAQVYASPTSDTPNKTLLRGARVLVFETSKGRTHIRAGSIEGWIAENAVVIP